MYFCQKCEAPVKVTDVEHPLRKLIRLAVMPSWPEVPPKIERTCGHYEDGIVARAEATVKAVGGVRGL